jgi:hypothetical protein
MATATETRSVRAILEEAISDLKDLEGEYREKTAALRQRLDSAEKEYRKTKEYSDKAGEKMDKATKRFNEHREAAEEAVRRWVASDDSEDLEDFRFHFWEMKVWHAANNILMGSVGSGKPLGSEKTEVRELRKELRNRQGGHETERLNVLSEALAEAFRASEGRLKWREETTDVLGCLVPEDCAPVIRDVLVGEIEDEELRGALDWAHKIVTKEGQDDG